MYCSVSCFLSIFHDWGIFFWLVLITQVSYHIPSGFFSSLQSVIAIISRSQKMTLRKFLIGRTPLPSKLRFLLNLLVSFCRCEWCQKRSSFHFWVLYFSGISFFITYSLSVLQDFTGVPAVVDLACMRDAMKNLGDDPKKINPLVSQNHLLLWPSVLILPSVNWEKFHGYFFFMLWARTRCAFNNYFWWLLNGVFRN